MDDEPDISRALYCDLPHPLLSELLGKQLGLRPDNRDPMRVLTGYGFAVALQDNPGYVPGSSDAPEYHTLLRVTARSGIPDPAIGRLLRHLVSVIRAEGYRVVTAADLTNQLASYAYAAQRTRYYVTVDEQHPRDRPLGLLRRRIIDGVTTDEEFTQACDWAPTAYLHRHWLGHNDVNYVEVTEEEAADLIATMASRQAAAQQHPAQDD